MASFYFLSQLNTWNIFWIYPFVRLSDTGNLLDHEASNQPSPLKFAPTPHQGGSFEIKRGFGFPLSLWQIEHRFGTSRFPFK